MRGVFRSRFKIALWCLVFALWSAVWLDRQTRELLPVHARVALAPRSFDWKFPFDDSPRARLQMIDAGEELDWPRLRALAEANPRDATILALAVRRDAVGFARIDNARGPLVSPYREWSVRIRDESFAFAPGTVLPTPPATAAPATPSTGVAAPATGPPPADVSRFLRMVRRGQRLEPQNTFWDWMEMGALIRAGRELELPAIAHRAAQKTVFDDHITDELRARVAYFTRQKAAFAPGVTVEAYSQQLLPHLSPIRTTTQFLAQLVMGLRLQKRDDAALALGMDSLYLARLIRLQGTNPLTSHVGKGCEQIIILHARVPLGAPSQVTSKSPLVALAANRASLLFLAQSRSPRNAIQIGTEWSRLARWNVSSLPNLFGDLVDRRTILGVGWTTRAAALVVASLPAALLLWAVVCLASRAVPRTPLVSPRLASWGAALGCAFLGACLAFDWFAHLSDDSYPLEWWATLFPSVLFGVRLPWGGASLLLLWLALWPRLRPQTPAPKRRIEDWEGPLLDTLPFQFLERATGAIRWFGRTLALMIIGMLFIGGTCAMFLVWPKDFPARAPLLSLSQLFYLSLSLVILPALWVGLRELRDWKQTRTFLLSPQLFAARARVLLGGYLFAALLILPPLLWAQSRFERDFHRQFAPIARGQMISAIQKSRGLPMQ